VLQALEQELAQALEQELVQELLRLVQIVLL
jgi:hypothetical protein